MFKELKSSLGFLYRGCVGIKDNFFDNPKISRGTLQCVSTSIGKTVNGQEIECYTFGSGKEKILYFGGIHGNEVGTVKLMNRWINYLNSKVGNKYIHSLKNKQILIIPCLNLDGYKQALKNPEYFSGGKYGKTNAHNVDLNRNFPTSNWSEKSTLFAAGKYFDISGGSSAGSEPETKALLELIKGENTSGKKSPSRIKTMYVFHSCWGTVMSTFTQSSDNKAKEFSKNSGYKIYGKEKWDKLSDGQKQGNGTMWGIENNIDYIEIEMRTRWGSEWKQNKKALIESLKL